MLFSRSGLSFSTHPRILFSSEYFHYKILIHEKCLEKENDKFQKNLSRPGKIDARARYRAAVRRLRNTALTQSPFSPLNYQLFHSHPNILPSTQFPTPIIILTTELSTVPLTFKYHTNFNFTNIKISPFLFTLQSIYLCNTVKYSCDVLCNVEMWRLNLVIFLWHFSVILFCVTKLS